MNEFEEIFIEPEDNDHDIIGKYLTDLNVWHCDLMNNGKIILYFKKMNWFKRLILRWIFHSKFKWI